VAIMQACAELTSISHCSNVIITSPSRDGCFPSMFAWIGLVLLTYYVMYRSR